MRHRNWARFLTSLVATGLILAACGGGDEPTTPGQEEQQIQTYEDLGEGDRVAVQRATTGSFWAEENLTPLGVEIVSFEKAVPMYQALQGGQVVGVLNDLPVSLDAVKGKPGLEVVQQIETGEEYAMAVSKDNPELLAALDAALETIYANGTFVEIYEKYFPGQELPEYAEEGGGGGGDIPTDFSTLEEGILTVGSDIPYPPFEMEEGGELTGFDVEIVRAVADLLGLSNEDDDWISTDFGTIFQQLDSGTKFDIVVAAVTAYAPEGSPAGDTVADRRKIVDFTLPYYPSLQSLTINTEQ